MAKFRGLTEIVLTTLEERMNTLDFPPTSHIAIQAGQYNTPGTRVTYRDSSFAWGVSSWGMKAISTIYKPEQPEK